MAIFQVFDSVDLVRKLSMIHLRMINDVNISWFHKMRPYFLKFKPTEWRLGFIDPLISRVTNEFMASKNAYIDVIPISIRSCPLPGVFSLRNHLEHINLIYKQLNSLFFIASHWQTSFKREFHAISLDCSHSLYLKKKKIRVKRVISH